MGWSIESNKMYGIRIKKLNLAIRPVLACLAVVGLCAHPLFAIAIPLCECGKFHDAAVRIQAAGSGGSGDSETRPIGGTVAKAKCCTAAKFVSAIGPSSCCSAATGAASGKRPDRSSGAQGFESTSCCANGTDANDHSQSAQIDVRGHISAAHVYARSAGCACSNSEGQCHCDDCQCSVERQQRELPPAGPLSNQMRQPVSSALVLSTEQLASVYDANSIRLAIQLQQESHFYYSAQAICAALSRFVC